MKYNSKEIFTISNFLSFIRLFLAIPIWFLLDDLESNRILISLLGITAVITDVLDGYLARKLNQITEFGKIIDPLGDKILVGVIIIKFYFLNLIPDYYFYLIIGRDILIFLVGIYISKILGKVLPSNMLGKITVLVISVIILLIFNGIGINNIIFKLLYLSSIILIFVSMIAYGIRALEFLKQKNNELI